MRQISFFPILHSSVNSFPSLSSILSLLLSVFCYLLSHSTLSFFRFISFPPISLSSFPFLFPSFLFLLSSFSHFYYFLSFLFFPLFYFSFYFSYYNLYSIFNILNNFINVNFLCNSYIVQQPLKASRTCKIKFGAISTSEIFAQLPGTHIFTLAAFTTSRSSFKRPEKPQLKVEAIATSDIDLRVSRKNKLCVSLKNYIFIKICTCVKICLVLHIYYSCIRDQGVN